MTHKDAAARPSLDPFAAAAVVLFVVGFSTLGYALLNMGSGAASAALVLGGLSGLAALAVLGAVIFGGSNATAEQGAGEGVIDALEEPAAITGADGRILICNAHWTDKVG